MRVGVIFLFGDPETCSEVKECTHRGRNCMLMKPDSESEQRAELLIVNCDLEASAAAINAQLGAAGSAGQVIKRENLTGDAATWIVVASTAVTMLPKILDSLAKVIESLKVRSIKIGEREIRNPTVADIRAFRKDLPK